MSGRRKGDGPARDAPEKKIRSFVADFIFFTAGGNSAVAGGNSAAAFGPGTIVWEYRSFAFSMFLKNIQCYPPNGIPVQPIRTRLYMMHTLLSCT